MRLLHRNHKHIILQDQSKINATNWPIFVPEGGNRKPTLDGQRLVPPTLEDDGISHFQSHRYTGGRPAKPLHDERVSQPTLKDQGIAELKLRAERQLGALLKEQPKHEGGRPPQNQLHDETGFQPTLNDQGISEIQSHRWQKEAERKLGEMIPERFPHGWNVSYKKPRTFDDQRSSLEDDGISYFQSHQYQRVADVPEEPFEQAHYSRMTPCSRYQVFRKSQ